MEKTRDSNIELLRILTMVGVIILHYNNPAIGGGLSFVEIGSVNYVFLNVIESICVCAVDLFLIISGYFMISASKRDLWKPVQLVTQVIVFSGCCNILSQVINGNFSIQGFIVALIPSNYFVVLYVVVFLISPYINLVIDNLEPKKRTNFLILIVILFSVYPTLIDVLKEITQREFIGLSSIGAYGSQYGYSVVNFVLCYCVGAWIKREEQKTELLSTFKIVFIWLFSVMLLTCWSIANDKMVVYTEKSAWEYCNPFVLLSGVCIFLLFKRIQLGSKKIINLLARGSFTVYLLHTYFITRLQIEKFVNGNILLLCVHMIVSGIVIYLSCWVVYIIYSKIEKICFDKIKKVFCHFGLMCKERRTNE